MANFFNEMYMRITNQVNNIKELNDLRDIPNSKEYKDNLDKLEQSIQDAHNNLCFLNKYIEEETQELPQIQNLTKFVELEFKNVQLYHTVLIRNLNLSIFPPELLDPLAPPNVAELRPDLCISSNFTHPPDTSSTFPLTNKRGIVVEDQNKKIGICIARNGLTQKEETKSIVERSTEGKLAENRLKRTASLKTRIGIKGDENTELVRGRIKSRNPLLKRSGRETFATGIIDNRIRCNSSTFGRKNLP